LKSVILFGVTAIIVAAMGCGSSTSMHERTHFSRTDSLTDVYLLLQDSLLQSWNRALKFELDRKEALGLMIEELANAAVIDDQQASAYNTRLEQIERTRFTQKSMTDPHVIEEYDKAFDELVRNITALSLATGHLQATVDELESLNLYNTRQRHYYDSIASQFNIFIEANWADLKELGTSVQLEQKPLFITVEN
jgi:hypothetical protein